MPFGPEHLALLIPIFALMIPILVIVLAHQRRMAELIHSQHAHNPHTEMQIDALRREVAELKELVRQQVIAVDSVVNARASQPMPVSPPVAPDLEIQQRTR